MSSPNVNTSSIPNTRIPGVYIYENTTNALSGLQPAGSKVCILAQRVAGGIVPANTPTKIFSDSDAALDFGQGSVAHLAAQAALMANPNLDLTVVGIDDSGSTKAKGCVTITGSAYLGGTVSFYVGDVQVDTSIPEGTAGVTGAYLIQQNINNVAFQLPVTCGLTGATSNQILFTAKNAGTVGNQVNIDYASIGATGIIGTWVGVTGMAGGSGDPDLGAYGTAGTVLNAVVSGDYDIYVSTLTDSTNLGKLKTMLDFVSGPIEERPAVAVVGYNNLVGTYAASKALAVALNSGRMSIPYLDYTNSVGLTYAPYRMGAGYAAVIASETDPARPLNNLVLAGMPANTIKDYLTRTQEDDLLLNGVAPLHVIPGEAVAIVRSITTYTVNSYGIPDPTLLDIQTIRSLDYVRESVRNRLQIKFPREKLTKRTSNLVRNEVLDVLYLLEGLEIVQNVDVYKSGVIVETDTQNFTQLNIKIPANIVSGLHVIAAVIDLILGS